MKYIKLTPYQSIFYYEWLKNPSRFDYNIVIDNTVTGKLDPERYNDSFEQLFNEHFITRHVIENTKENGLCWKLVEPIVNLTIFHDKPLSDDEIYAIVTKPFDLHNGPLARIHLIKINDDCYRMIFIFHHIVVDGISTEEIWDKWRKLYNGIPYQMPSLAEQAVMHQNLYQYFDRILVNNKNQMVEFWQKHLKNISGVDLSFLQSTQIQLKTQNSLTFSEYLFSQDENITKQVNGLRRQYKLTPYLFGQLVLAILLNKMSGNDDIALAYPIAILEGKDLLYGAHINTMIIDYRFNENTTLNSLINQTLTFYKELKTSHAKYLPINEIIRCGNDSSLLNVAFAQTFYRDHEVGLIGIKSQTVNHTFQVDLASKLLFEQQEHNNQINYRVRFDTKVLDEKLVKNFIVIYQQLFKDILSLLTSGFKDKAIKDIDLINSQQYLTTLLSKHNEKPLFSDVICQFEKTVCQFPERLAIIYNDKQLTYRQLNQKSNQLAAYLISKFNPQPDDLIALCLEKSEWMPICILAILKAGAAYVPLDTHVPKQRLAYILQDIRAKVIITCSTVLESLNSMITVNNISPLVIDNETFQADLSLCQQDNLNLQLNLNQLAYVIYTSGTTGLPKGVMIEHHGLANLATMQTNEFGLAIGVESIKNCLWYSSYVFDAHVSEMFTAIINGHCLHILSEDKRLDFNLLANYIRSANIQIATIPPALLNKDQLLSLETLIVAGESCNVEIMQCYHQQGTKVINAYGPTECTVCATLHHYKLGDSNLNIGLPLKNIEIHILDKYLKPLPLGVIGDLYISGIGLARGYLNNLELTAQVFMINPFAGDIVSQKRMYKTGDLARQMPDGTIEYAGRKDFQVKIRGFRIELAEIENYLSQIPQINRSLVLAYTLPSGLKTLVAYYSSDVVLNEAEILVFLGNYLPEYMLPNLFIRLPEFPLTINGKINRSALPLPNFTEQIHYIAPENEIEAILCQIYAEILGFQQVGIDDDFLKLGGDSISGILLVNKIRQKLNVIFSIKDIFTYKTPRLLAKNINNGLIKQDTTVIAEKGQLSGIFKLLPIQQWFFNCVEQGLFLDYQHWNQSFILAVPKLNVDILQQSLKLLVSYHDALRLIFIRNDNGIYTQCYCEEINNIPFEYVNLTAQEDSEKQLFNQWQLGFDIYHGPLFHIGYIESNNCNQAKLHFAFHHLIMDTVSWHLIKQDLQKIYHILVTNPQYNGKVEDILGEKSSSYRQWVACIQDYTNDHNIKDEEIYWLRITQGIKQYRQQLAPFFVHKQVNNTLLTLDKDYTKRLQNKIHDVLSTQISDILLACFVTIIKQFTDIEKQYITLEGHGRKDLSTRIDITRTVGWFTNMYPVSLIANTAILSHIADIKDIVSDVSSRSIGFAPIFGYQEDKLSPISFNYLGQFDETSKHNWQFVFTDSGATVSENNNTINWLSFDCGIVNGELKIKLKGYLDNAVITELGEKYIVLLKETIDYLLSVNRHYLTSADISYIVSNNLLAQLQKSTEIESIYLANSLQEGFIYHAINQGNTDDAYRVQMFWDYKNELDIRLLKKAWQLVQINYASLRLRFNWDEELIQIIDKTSSLNWYYYDVADYSLHQQQHFFEELQKQDREQPYDLTVSGLFRVYLVKFNEHYYRCIFSSHHAILDGWSNAIVIKVIHDTYLSLLKDENTKLNTNQSYQKVQQYLQKNRTEHLTYWQHYLSKQQTKENLSLLLANNARGIQLNSYKYINTPKQKTLTIENDLYLALKELSSQYGLTINAVLQYCWHKVLSVFTGSNETIVGMVVAGRNLPIEGIEQTVGLLINTLPLIVVHQESASLLALIEALQHDIYEANSRSNVNLAMLQQSSERLFNSLFVFENYPISNNAFGDVLTLHFHGAEEKQDYPLVIKVTEKSQRLMFTLCYAGELFANNLIDNLLSTVEQVLKQIVKDPHQQHNKINYLNEQQYQMVVYDWNNNACNYCGDKTVVNLFEQQVELSSDHMAIIFNDITLTYQQLNQKVNQLAHYLRNVYRLQPNDLVGLYLDRSEKIIISILAVLKAGAAYVPMDPAAPDERNQFIISDAKTKVVICEQACYARISQFTSNILVIDQTEINNEIARQSIANPININTSDDLAYCIYTSGTTGKPKGGLISHRNINRLIINQSYTEITENDRLLAISNYIFDASIYDIFGSLLNGASLVIAEKQSLLDLTYFNQLIIDRGITHFFTPTVFFNTLVDAHLTELARIKYIFVGGETLSVNHVNQFRKYYPSVKLVNAYGPTETTTYATTYLTNTSLVELNHTVPIGRPINNTTLYILNSELQPVPIGAVGELYIGGAGVGQGYLNNPALTAKVFIQNPFQTETEIEKNYNGIIYKTGDLVRYLADSNIEYLGRNDFQVKIRGFRIELGEIEACLINYPEIKQALVIAMSNDQGEKRLIAYYVAEQAISRDAIYDYLSQSLPEYMIPVAFVHLKEFPLTVNDKIDRKALPLVTIDNTVSYIAPTSLTEQQIIKIYSELLSRDMDKISVMDDFFKLGGNSILAIKLASRLSAFYSKSIHVADIFNFKTIRSMSQYINQLTNQKQEIIVTNVNNVQEQLLSYAQERLWFIDRFAGGSDAYNIPLALSLKPQVSLTILTKALNKIIERHEILRTIIKINDQGEGYQYVLTMETINFNINSKICRDMDELNDSLYQHAHKVFDLSSEIPISVQIFYLEHQSYLSIVIHHIAFDGWSIELFNKELTYYYRFYNEPDTLADLPEINIQYKDFALWQRNYLQGGFLQSQLDYWKLRLQDYQPLNLTIDYKRPLNFDYRGEDIDFNLTKETSIKLRQLATDLNVSLYTVLLSGYFLLLKAYCNQSDMLIGIPIAGRHYPGIENTIGFFVNTLGVRCLINDNESLAQFIQSTGKILTEAQTYQDLPFEKLVDALQLEKDSSKHPLFQVMFGMYSFGIEDENDSQQLFTSYQPANRQYKVAKFDLSTFIDDSKETISGTFNYATALFKAKTIERYISTYCYILEQFNDLVRQKQTISQLSYLDKTQFNTIIYDWNKTDCEYYADKTVVSLFEQQVQKSAHHPAVIFKENILTYSQLNQQANQLAHYLQLTYKIKPNDLIGLYLERSEKIVISILAVLKAGAAYVPMDTNSPDERNQFIINDTDVKAIITEQVHIEKVSQFTTNVIAIDHIDTKRIISNQPTDNPNSNIQSNNLAYCIYTSGTTGKPKGTLITHRNINHLVINANYTNITSDDRLLAISSYQFDASTYDFFASLLNGASLVIIDKSMLLDLVQLNHLIDEQKITNCFITAAFFNILVDAELSNLVYLNYVLVGGETLSVYHVNRFRQLYPNVKLVNVYGPTETTTYAVSFLVNTVDTEFNYSVPIGKPINNTTVYILDHELRPLPIGAIGELYIGGGGVGVGYLNNTQLTNDVFLNNPFQTKVQEDQNYNGYFYKTGDLVRYLDDSGNIEYIGRNDFQVKIRGFRVELAEIELYLMKHAEINQVLVIVRDNAQGDKRLIAYYVAMHPIDHDQLFDFLKQYLPEYMIPVEFIYLEAFPLTLNGKINLAALPVITSNKATKYIAPTTRTEQKVALLYAEILNLNQDNISIDDDFFRMGGNSILAIKLANRLSSSTEKTIHVADIFNYKTIYTLSQYIDTLTKSQYVILPQHIDSIDQQLLSFAQERLWFIDSYVGGSNAYNIPLILKLNQKLSMITLTKALNKIITRHEILRTVIKTNNAGEGYQEVLAMEDVKLNIGVKKCQDIEELNNSIIDHIHKVFNLSAEIPFSVQSYQLHEQMYLSLVIHHIAFDGWSIELLLKELNYYYSLFNSSLEQPDLPEVSVQYKDFALWQRHYLQGEQLQLQLNYWQEKLNNYQSLNLPTDYYRPREIDYSGADINFSLTKETSQKLRQLAANLNVSLYTVLLSGYFLLLKAYSNQQDIILGTPIAGRHYLGIEDTIGFFVNTLALRREIDDHERLEDFIQTTGKLLSEAQKYQDLPFEKLVDALVVNKDSSRHPIFQVMFGVQSFGSLSSQSMETLFTPYQAESIQYHIAKFDLTTILDDSQEMITGHFNYATALFKSETIEHYIEAYCHILDQFSEFSQKHLPINQLSYLNDVNYKKVIYQWNETQQDYPKNKTLAQMFEEQVNRTPDNIAIIYEDICLTYQELNIQANQLATYLKEQYVIHGDDLITICLDKTEQIIIAILAVLKAGAAYVPLSPNLPEDRKHWIIDDTQCKVVITLSKYEADLNKILQGKTTALLCIDKINRNNNCINNLVTETTANHLAYVIYTSGTTGKPKGVMIEQYSVINATFVQRKTIGLTICNDSNEAKHILWYSDYSFDVHIIDVFTPLLTGNCVHIFAQDKRLDLQALINYVTAYHIDYSSLPPALLDKNQIIPIQRIIIGGETTSQHVIDYYIKQQRLLINGYGPTEATIWTTFRILCEGDSNNNIGKPIYNSSVYVLDNFLRPVPIGALGELYIGGEGVGRGYLNNFELTNKVFIKNPFQTEKQKRNGENNRLYKTGDIVRYLEDGNIKFIGRNDFQVKIRGFRIELAEIESQLIKHPAIKQALVIAYESENSKQLVAYYVSEKSIEHKDLFDYLKHYLPEYMIPVVFIHIKAIPITLNGKINRSALPAVKFTSDNHYVEPQTETECKLTQVYSELLSIEKNNISIIDDFFRMGGNSILAIKLATRLSDLTGKAIHIADIFNYKTIQSLSEYIDTIACHKIVITKPEIHKIQDQRLSFAQERLWFIHNYEGGSSAYNIPLVLVLKQGLSLAILAKAINKIILRHEILRTIINVDADGIGYQYVLTPENINVTINPIQCQDENQLNQQISKHINQIFDLTKHIPLSAQSYQLNGHNYLSLVIHHIAFDGWSIDLLIKELNYYYRFFSANETQPELPAIDVQYKDFALWQRQYLQGEILQVQLDYWRNQLIDYQALNLPIDFPRPMKIDYQGADINFSLTLEVSQNLRHLAASLNVSLYTVLLSAYYLLLRAYSNQSDILLGIPIAGRHYSGIENTIGFFVNTLVLRRKIESQQNLADFITNTGVLLNEAQQYQDLPFEKLVELLQVEKDPSRHPLFQVMFSMQSFGSADKHNAQSFFSHYEPSSAQYNIAKFDLSTMLDDSEEIITGNFNYATALFKAETIIGYIDVYRNILAQLSDLVLENKSISQLNYLDELNYNKLIIQWNQTRQDYPKNKTIYQMFEEQVIKTPDNIAVIYEENKLTYRELNEKANQLAAYLRDNFTIEVDNLVALYLDRSLNMIIAIMAVLKSGAAYVPIDPAAPNDRSRYILENTKAKLVLTVNNCYEKCLELVDGTQPIVNLQETKIMEQISLYSCDNLEPLAKANHLAYVIYTSGTTGNPKGVMLEHQGVINRIVWMQNEYPITEQDRILQKTNYTFDVSVWELFWANWYGACIVFAHSELYKDNVYLAELIESEQITVLHFVPSMLVAFVETVIAYPVLQTKLQKLKYLFCSGEALNLYEVKQCHRLFPNCQIHNLYGPTEATVDVLFYDCNKPNINQVLIGRPIANTAAYILNEQLQPIPIGGIGELYIGGDGVARGYLYNPELSKQRFIANPFQTDLEKQQNYNSRIYKTGDVVRYKYDGMIEYLGRNDFQVKIRGYRIELKEIEACLVNHPAINYAVVIAYERADKDKYLVAYYVANCELDVGMIINYLRQTLPEYMLPVAFVHLNSLPVTSNGKLNRKQLPIPEINHSVEHVLPANEKEKILLDLFADTLNISAEDISMKDNFFTLGGNSILAMKLNSRINQLFQIRLSLVDILNSNTITILASKIASMDKQEFNPVVTMTTITDKPQIFMIHPGMGGCSVYLSLANRLSNSYCCYGVDSYNFYHDDKIEKLDQLAQYYLSFMDKVLDPTKPITLLGWSLGGQIALEIATILEARKINNIKVCALDTWLFNPDDLNEDIPRTDLDQLMTQLNIPKYLRAKVESVADIDMKLSLQPLSGKLKYTRIVLFKAKDEKNLGTLYQKYSYNNIDSYLYSLKQLTVIELTTDHYKILENEQEIIDNLKKFD